MTDTKQALQKAFDELRLIERMCLVGPPHATQTLDVGHRIGLVRKDLEAALAAPQQRLNWTPVVKWWESGNEDFDKLKDAVLAMLAAAPEPQPVKQAPQYCGTSHCSCIECVMEKKP